MGRSMLSVKDLAGRCSNWFQVSSWKKHGDDAQMENVLKLFANLCEQDPKQLVDACVTSATAITHARVGGSTGHGGHRLDEPHLRLLVSTTVSIYLPVAVGGPARRAK